MNLEVIKSACTSFLRDEEGATAVEYALMAALIAGVIVVVVGALGGTLNTKFKDICNAIGGAGSC